MTVLPVLEPSFRVNNFCLLPMKPRTFHYPIYYVFNCVLTFTVSVSFASASVRRRDFREARQSGARRLASEFKGMNLEACLDCRQSEAV